MFFCPVCHNFCESQISHVALTAPSGAQTRVAGIFPSCGAFRILPLTTNIRDLPLKESLCSPLHSPPHALLTRMHARMRAHKHPGNTKYLPAHISCCIRNEETIHRLTTAADSQRAAPTLPRYSHVHQQALKKIL